MGERLRPRSRKTIMAKGVQSRHSAKQSMTTSLPELAAASYSATEVMMWTLESRGWGSKGVRKPFSSGRTVSSDRRLW